ncbi:DNA adenine methylase [Stenotrophomonas maltophilia]|uniref:DNA adenine methylase n=1 Tax=Stenotrophomonas maltophilia TaxID=40324 RepID=UPI0015DE8FC0|nr:DNA adenine methylase [Stenotrophomonas maltophilia]MBA0272294.1 DNA adenine methylase [Stenotrophomonas maltophilia]
MYSNKLYTPLRYPGGKARFSSLIERIIRDNDLHGGHYFEPFAGGAGLALILLVDDVVEAIHINDIDPAVAAFWKAAVSDTDRLIRMVEMADVSMDAWHHWRSVMIGEAAGTDLERGFATLFMNRTNRSGILKGGVIGGKQQAGKYRLDARFMREKICERLKRIGQLSSRINVYEEDAQSILHRSTEFLPERTLIYLDPPYYVKGAGLYRNSYKDDDHKKIARLLLTKDFPFPWIVSYDNAAEIREMYGEASGVSYGLNYTAQRRYVGDEVMYFSDRLSVVPNKI